MSSEEVKKDRDEEVGEAPSEDRARKANTKKDRNQRFQKGIEVQK